MKISVETSIAAPIEAVWKAYTTPEDIIQWNTASEDWHTMKASVDLKEGGSFSSRMEAKDGSFSFDFSGAYTSMLLNRQIAYSFGTGSRPWTSKQHQLAPIFAFNSTLKKRIPLSNSKAAGQQFSQ